MFKYLKFLQITMAPFQLSPVINHRSQRCSCFHVHTYEFSIHSLLYDPGLVFDDFHFCRRDLLMLFLYKGLRSQVRVTEVLEWLSAF